MLGTWFAVAGICLWQRAQYSCSSGAKAVAAGVGERQRGVKRYRM